MIYSVDRFQVVVVDCPYDSIQNEVTQKWFSKFLAAKLGGYAKEYPYGVLPFGVYDMIGTILMLCEKNSSGNLDPIMVFKSTSMERCDRFNLPFELMEYYHRDGSEAYEKSTLEILNVAKQKGVNVGYNSSWTILKKVRENPDLIKFVRDVSVMMITNHYPSQNISEVMITGVVKFKVDQLLKLIGFDYLKLDGHELPPIACPFLFQENTAVMHLKEFSSYAKGVSSQYQYLWENRVIIGKTHELEEKEKIAA